MKKFFAFFSVANYKTNINKTAIVRSSEMNEYETTYKYIINIYAHIHETSERTNKWTIEWMNRKKTLFDVYLLAKKRKTEPRKQQQQQKWNGRYTINVCNKGKMSSVCVIDSMNNLIQYSSLSLPLCDQNQPQLHAHIGTNTHTWHHISLRSLSALQLSRWLYGVKLAHQTIQIRAALRTAAWNFSY